MIFYYYNNFLLFNFIIYYILNMSTIYINLYFQLKCNDILEFITKVYSNKKQLEL